MKRILTVALIATAMLSIPELSEARRTRVVVRGSRTHVAVRTGFPIRRTLPNVIVRTTPAVRVTPRAYLAPVAFGGVVVASVPANVRAWSDSEDLDREDGWTDFTMNVDRHGSRLLLEIENGAAQISFAEVVFENGDVQVVDFNDRSHRRGIYSLLDFKDGRKIDHVRVVAKAASSSTEIRLHLSV